MIYKGTKTGLIFLTGILLILTACKHDRNHPGYAYMAERDMYYSDPYDPYTANPSLRDSLTMLPAVEGTVARGTTLYPYKAKSYFDQIDAGKELMNPVPLSQEALAKGKEQYDIYCMTCHGERGKGNGYLYTSKKFSAKPTSLVESHVQSKPDGEIYHIISVGSLSGLMGPHASQITPENRWNIIYYMRELAK